MKNRSQFKHSFTNRSYLHSAVLKALHGFQEERAHMSRDMQFFLQNVQNDFFRNDFEIFRMFKKQATETKISHS